MKKLTIAKLKAMDASTVIATGVGLIEHPWFNDATPVSEGGTLEDDGCSTKVKWVAIRGGIHDWCIYHSMDANITKADYFDNPEHLKASDERILKYGAKLYQMDKVQKFVPCDEEALSMYRR